MVTCFSCIASNNADWTFGGAWFISSAKTKLEKIDPFTVLNEVEL